jgi:RPA family protein
VSDAEGGAGRREVAYRLFAAEYDDADLSYSAGEEERAPNYVVTPTGARVNRAFVVGVLTEVEAVSDDVLRARVVDPTGAFVLYAGQYQPDEQAFLDRADTPAFVAVTGKARTFQPEDADRVYTSLRPESVNEVDADTRDRWTVATAERTLGRVGWMAAALGRDERGGDLEAALAGGGADEGLAAGVALALDHYDTSPAYLAEVREMTLDAARLVAGEVDEVEPVSVAPDAPGEADLGALADLAGLSGPAAEPSVDPTDEPAAETDEKPATGDSVDAASAPPAETAAGGTEAVEAEPAAAETGGDVGDFEPGEFELDEEEREEIEEEFGTEFQSGTEVEEPGEADIGTPDDGTGADEVEPAARTEATASGGEQGDAAVDEAEDVDLGEATVEVMRELDDGGGADREELVAAVVERHGADPGDVEDAIQDALMDGRCYEPDDATLKPI